MLVRATFALCVLASPPSLLVLGCGSGPRTEVQSAVIGAPNAPTPGWDGGVPVAPSAPPHAERVLGEGLTFGHLPVRVGDRFEEQSSNAYVMTMRIGSMGAATQVTSIENTERETKQVEVLALVKGDTVSKVRVTYKEKSASVGMAGSSAPTPTPLAGKTYVVENKDGKTTVLSDRGSVPLPTEVTAVVKDHRRLGKPDAIATRMPERPLHVGEAVPELAQAVAEELGEDSMKPTAVRVTLREKKGDAGVFDLVLTLGRDEGMMSFSVTLSGQMTLRTADAQMTSVDLAGPLVIAPTQAAANLQGPQPTSVEGDGHMELHVRRVYSGSR
jgi:hypothetical protein